MRAVVGPADFLRSVGELGATGAGAAGIARLLGYDLGAAELDAQPGGEGNESGTNDPTTDTTAAQVSVMATGDAATEHFAEVAVVLEEGLSEPVSEPPAWWASTRALDEEVPGQAWANPTPEPLFAPERQRDVLRVLGVLQPRGQRGLLRQHDGEPERDHHFFSRTS